MGLSGFNIRKLQSLQESLVKIFTSTSKYSHKIPVLKFLHWLPVQQWSVFKTATVVCTSFAVVILTIAKLFLESQEKASLMEGEIVQVKQFITSVT